MTRFAYIVAAMTALAAVPAAAGTMGMGENPELNNLRQTNMTQVDRRAGDLFSSRELSNRGLSANDTVSVSFFAPNARPDDVSRDRM
ncbi:MAG: hypothetical protein L0G27_04230 [Paracoccus sp. (in: a-proteobacteria)]|nr:hypothetical protein [Paracoccus sp. (in: a-proteobacteria)]